MKISFSEKSVVPAKFAKVLIRKEKNNYIQINPKGEKEIVVALDDAKKINHRKLILLARKVIFLAKGNRIKNIVVNFKDFQFPQLNLATPEIAELLATNFEMANYEFNRFKTPPKEGWNFINEIVVIVEDGLKEIKRHFEKGQIIGQFTNLSRDLSNTPGSDITPETLAKKTQRLTKGTKIKTTVFDDKKLEKLGMRSILSIGQGSHAKPRLIILQYQGAGKQEKPLVLVGKAVTFDTGGINLKPGDGLKDMHLDMAGGAAIIAAVLAAEKLKLKKNIVALIPAAENMLSGSAFRPGDIITSLSGKTIEVSNTDAEGRILLADALTYAKTYNPAVVINVASLTGAAWVALGNHASALFTKDSDLEKKLLSFGEQSGDYLWPFPLWEEYEEEIKGKFADLNNTGKYSRLGGAITAAAFLYQFAQNYRWAHIDIARLVSYEGEYLSAGAYGTPVRLLVRFAENF